MFNDVTLFQWILQTSQSIITWEGMSVRMYIFNIIYIYIYILYIYIYIYICGRLDASEIGHSIPHWATRRKTTISTWNWHCSWDLLQNISFPFAWYMFCSVSWCVSLARLILTSECKLRYGLLPPPESSKDQRLSQVLTPTTLSVPLLTGSIHQNMVVSCHIWGPWKSGWKNPQLTVILASFRKASSMGFISDEWKAWETFRAWNPGQDATCTMGPSFLAR